jgi:hypothetical protein
MENQLVVVLPEEIAQIAANVSVEKRNEVQTVLNHVFNGVSKMREQLDSVAVVDQNDKVNMKLANTIRLGVRQVRLEAEKTFDAKRAEVQQQMLSYKTEDSLWLKAKQTMQILTKEIEENARWKEETKERFEAEQKELKTQQRMIKVAKVAPEMARTEFESMSDETFEMFFTGIEKAFNDKIEAEKKAEEARIQKEKEEAAERERIKVENERLKKEAEEKEKALEVERKKQKDEKDKKDLQDKKRNEELKPYIIFIRDYVKLLNSPEKEYQKELAEIKIGAKQHYEFEAKKAKEAEEKEKRDKAEKDKLQAELQEKQKAEIEAKAKADKEEKLRVYAENKAAKAPDKEKLNAWVNDIRFVPMPVFTSKESQDIALDITLKFSAFKKWAKTQIESI